MMNLIAIILVATSLAVAGVFSPNPQDNNCNNGGEQVIVKEGHRAVAVEYTDTTGTGDGNTKVSISDQLSRATASVAGVAQDAAEGVKEALKNPDGPHGASPRELICDAYGKCKHKIAVAWSNAREKAAVAEEGLKEAMDKAKDLVEERTQGVRENVKEKARETGGKAREAAEKVKEKTGEVVKEAMDKAKDLGSRVTDEVEEHTQGVRENVKEKVGEAGEVVKEAVDKAKDMASSATHEVKERTETVRGNAKERFREAGDTTQKVKEKAREKAGQVKEKTAKMEEATVEKISTGKKRLSNIAKRGKERVFDAIRHVFWPESMDSLMGMIQMLGLAMAYGTSMWVTFIMSHVLARVLPRQQFGIVQSKVYPVYFKTMVVSVGLALIAHLLGQKGKLFTNQAAMLQDCNLMISLVFVFVNLLVLEPLATKVMFERMKLEKEEGRGEETVVSDAAGPIPTTSGMAAASPPQTTAGQEEAKSKMAKLRNRLTKLNSYSSLCNIMTLMGLTWHLVYLSQHLRFDTSSTSRGGGYPHSLT